MVTRLNCIDALGSFNKCRNDLVLLHSLGREMLLHSQDQLISGRVRTNVRQLEVTTVLAQCVCIQFVKIHPHPKGGTGRRSSLVRPGIRVHVAGCLSVSAARPCSFQIIYILCAHGLVVVILLVSRRCFQHAQCVPLKFHLFPVGKHQPVPSSQTHGFLHVSFQSHQRALGSIVACDQHFGASWQQRCGFVARSFFSFFRSGSGRMLISRVSFGDVGFFLSCVFLLHVFVRHSIHPVRVWALLCAHRVPFDPVSFGQLRP
mmetsp:Transcript_4838/g.30782  ORF Transcript_4838/g.30782 Transcript_4838/m.30782 type:complete len:260 (-) Transcript_4838:413-1192(-)